MYDKPHGTNHDCRMTVGYQAKCSVRERSPNYIVSPRQSEHVRAMLSPAFPTLDEANRRRERRDQKRAAFIFVAACAVIVWVLTH